ncbi:MAG: L-aspartate oxidase [Campylobacterales bacterium]
MTQSTLHLKIKKKNTMMYDVIIVGSGVAGLQCALNLDRKLTKLIICKDEPTECNTSYAQGGIAVSIDKDDIQSHIEDALRAGAGLCSKEAVEVLCYESRICIDDLIKSGFVFDKDSVGSLHYTKEGAHSRHRVLHAGGDRTGRVLEEFLLSHSNAHMLQNSSVSDIYIEDGICKGIEICRDGEFDTINCSCLVLAFGGVGSIFGFHTNSKTVNGQLTGLCSRRGFTLKNMEMTQFHPTVFVDNNWVRKLLLSEALRGEGAKIVDRSGYAFLKEYDIREELASRDIISRAIYEHSYRYNTSAYLDLSSFSKEYFKVRFPFIYENLTKLGYNPPKDPVPISPAFHYTVGGIATNLFGQTHTYSNVYAIGECAYSGVHGGNRLASNSLLEGLVFGKRAALHINDNFTKLEASRLSFSKKEWKKDDDAEVKKLIRDTMWNKCGIVRTKNGLDDAKKTLANIDVERIGFDVECRLEAAKTIIKQAIDRGGSIGAHFIKN